MNRAILDILHLEFPDEIYHLMLKILIKMIYMRIFVLILYLIRLEIPHNILLMMFMLKNNKVLR